MARKKYSIHWEEDVAVSFEVNGVEYQNLEDIPDGKDREKLEAMLNSAEDAEFDAEFADLQKQAEQVNSAHPERIIISVFTGIGILMLAIAVLSSAANILKVNREESAPGRVVEMIERPNYDEEGNRIGEYYLPVVEFVSKDGKYHNVPLSEGSYPPAYEVGEDVTILYEPDTPTDARIRSGGSTALMWILPGITGTLGLAFIGIITLVQRVLFTQDTEAQ
jgi:hypothetical protein